MKATDTKEYAFPLKEPLSSDELGMTLRDYFAAKAMQGLCAHGGAWGDMHIKEISNAAYSLADAMLAERNKESSK